TGRLSLDAHPWLADHVVAGRVVVPGTALLELAIRAGDEVGCRYLEELTLEALLVLPDENGVRIQLSVGSADASGRHIVAIHSSPGGEAAGTAWIRHATGVLASTAPDAPNAHATPVASGATGASGDTAWPPAGAEPVSLGHLYGDGGFAAAGLDYGPAFQGLRKAWRLGDELFAEVTLPAEEAAEATRFGVHPALLDAALHAVALAQDTVEPGTARLPFSWSAVDLHATGASSVRVRLSPKGPNGVSVLVADQAGAPVATIGALSFRPLMPEALSAAQPEAAAHLWQLEWTSAHTPHGADDSGVVVADGLADVRRLLRDPDPVADVVVVPTPAGADDAAAVHEAVLDVLSLLQEWLADERCEASCLVVVTRGAHGGGDLAADAVWG
ncbi:polyketide synthase dehydratase domain-containing protein, partial [Streptomyces sp. NPDC048612]|uniref:polyketide synthase dehydratase domain-containing protein n=1 Tax=Streptomyces sp. NPDC048612 TaxID=3365579 RepID=UPI00371952EB